MTFYNAKSDDSPMIIIIKHAQIKEPQGQYDLTVSNAWSGSKLILDPNQKEIMDFAARLFKYLLP
jgi:replication factor A1